MFLSMLIITSNCLAASVRSSPFASQLQRRLCLFSAHCRKLVQESLQGITRLETIKEDLHRHPSPDKDRCSAKNVGIAMNNGDNRISRAAPQPPSCPRLQVLKHQSPQCRAVCLVAAVERAGGQAPTAYAPVG
jgi:hypothetical protein